MSPTRKRNVGHSVFQRLLKHAKTHGEDFNLLLLRYGLERLLYRLSISPYADRFILKGASLFLVWKVQDYRVTKDADLLGFGTADTERIKSIFQKLCQTVTESVDGIEFIPDTVKVAPIREEHVYDGIRVTLMGMLHQAQIPLQIDICFGDAVTPAPEQIKFPTLLDAPPPQLLAYPRYTMVAEKLEAMVRLGVADSRMKDFYDVFLLSRLFDFDGWILCDAIRNTFVRRSTLLPRGLPMAFTDEFRKDTQKQTQWQAFLRKAKPKNVPEEIDAVIGEVASFLVPVLKAASEDKPFQPAWSKGGSWGITPICQ
jgi:predicted nucleotidyltransferase component of viral defense system